MHSIPGQSQSQGDGKRLLKLFKSLAEADRHTLLQFAEFLAQRPPQQAEAVAVPEPIPRPDNETVIAAIKRLSATYPMLDKSQVLNDTSSLMAQHVIQGRAGAEVIDELERVFEEHYRRLADAQQ